MSKRILVVEDDPPIREVVKRILNREGYIIDEAGDGEEALTKVKADHYSAIVLDLMLPKVSGYEVLDYLTRERPNSKCVVIISAALEREIDKADPTIVKAVLRKPFDLQDLVGAVDACVKEVPAKEAV
jgi:DNA-binding response OmpR family regulator